MSISINGSTGISGVDGSAATPALQGGDTNTGISFGTDEVQINTGGTQRAVVDASGRLGLGTSSPNHPLHVVGGDESNNNNANTIAVTGTNHVRLKINTPTTGGYRASLVLSSDEALSGTGNEVSISTTGSDELRFSTGGSDRVFIDSSGRVGIGNTTPGSFISGGSPLVVGSGSGSQGITIYAGSSNASSLYFADGTTGTALYRGTVGYEHSTDSIFFSTAAAERARIDSSGRLLVATSTSQGSYNLQCFGTGVWGQGAYVNGSDVSIKQNINDISSSLEVVKSLRPVTFEYKPEYSQDQTVQAGFIAQELQQAMAGQEYLDGIVQQGTNHLNVAYQSIIPVLTKALQEAIAKIETLEAEVQALKGGN